MTIKTEWTNGLNCQKCKPPPFSVSGLVSLHDWASAVESVMHLGVPWRMLRYQLVTNRTSDGMIDYHEWFNELAIKGPNTDVSMFVYEK